MSLKPQPIPDIPEDTARIARAAFRKGNTWVSLRDELGSIYKDEDFASLFSTRGQPAQAPWQLALVTIMQFAEGLSDTQAASSVCGRIDWKYALSLELTDPGFDASVLCEFRARLIEGQAEKHMLEAILKLCRERNLIKERGKQRSDSTHVLAAIHVLNRLESVGTTMRNALNTLAVAAPEWLRAHTEPDWIERYGARVVVSASGRRDAQTGLGAAVLSDRKPNALAYSRRARTGSCRSWDSFAARHRCALLGQTEHDLGRLQSAPDRDLCAGSRSS